MERSWSLLFAGCRCCSRRRRRHLPSSKDDLAKERLPVHRWRRDCGDDRWSRGSPANRRTERAGPPLPSSKPGSAAGLSSPRPFLPCPSPRTGKPCREALRPCGNNPSQMARFHGCDLSATQAAGLPPGGTQPGSGFAGGGGSAKLLGISWAKLLVGGCPNATNSANWPMS